jgi:hypothetical protein
MMLRISETRGVKGGGESGDGIVGVCFKQHAMRDHPNVGKGSFDDDTVSSTEEERNSHNHTIPTGFEVVRSKSNGGETAYSIDSETSLIDFLVIL